MVTWEEKVLDDLFDFSGGFSASRADLSHTGHRYLHYGDIHGTTKSFIDINDENIPRLDVELRKINVASLLKDGDVVFVDASEDAEGASKYIVIRNRENVPYISGLHTIVAKTKTNELDKLFREYCFRTFSFKEQIKFFAVGTKVTGVSKNSIKKIKLCFPTCIREQSRIAQALSDTDAYIVALEKLIAKKRAIKQGAMQELLTGQRRLDGFTEEWTEIFFGDLFEFIPNNSFTRADMSPVGDVKNIHYGDILVKYSECVDVEKDALPYISEELNTQRFSGRCYGKSGDIVIADTAEDDTVGKALELTNVQSPVLSGQHTIFCRPQIIFAERFLAYYLNSYTYHSQLLPYIVGTKVSSISRRSISETIVRYPTVDEQSAIAQILSDMDAELDALATKLEKIRLIKQGMMSELLSGNIRLVEQELPLKVVSPKKKTKTEVSKQGNTGHNQKFDDAVMLAGLVNILHSPKYPLGRKRLQKCLYLLRRYRQESTTQFKKKAAGPYDETARYKGGESIATKNGYIIKTSTQKGMNFGCGEKIAEALGYIASWGRETDMRWVATKLKYQTTNNLELLATVDMASCDLQNAGTSVTVASIKQLIETTKEWKDKLQKEYFSDDHIARAIKELKTLL